MRESTDTTVVGMSTARRHLDVRTTAQDADALLTELWAALDPSFRVAATTFAPITGVRGPIRHA